MTGLRPLGAGVLAALAAGGCTGADRPSGSAEQAPPIELRFVEASAELRAKCRSTAKAVGYAVPCPTRVPPGLANAGGPTACLDIIGPGGTGTCGKAWRKWVVGTSEWADQHLVITASPGPLRNDAKLVNGPAWYPAARVRPLRGLMVNGRRMRAVYVPPETNAGSAFMDHVVLIWTVRGHTYGIGFHNVHGLRQTLELDVALARGIRLVAP